MCWPTQARSPRARQNVLLSSAPQPSAGRLAGTGRARLAGRVAARAPQHQRRRAQPGRHRAEQGVVGAGVDRPVVDHERVGDGAEASSRIGVQVGDRLLGDVARGHHQRRADVGEQQVMQRRVREHHPEVRASRRDRRGDRRPGAPASDDDRPHAVGEQGLLGRGELDELAGAVEVRRHERERLALAPLALAQGRHRALVGRRAGEVVAADPLDRQDRARDEHPGGGLDRVAVARPRRERLAGGVDQGDPGPALGAGVRLGVEAAVERVLVLGPAALAHVEGGHRGQRAVVGDAGDDRKAGPAVGAVREGVAMAPVGGIEDLGEALGAGGEVRGDEGLRGSPSPRLEDPELALAPRRRGLHRHRLDRRQRRRVGAQPREQLVDRGGRALDLEHHPALVVQHPAAERQL